MGGFSFLFNEEEESLNDILFSFCHKFINNTNVQKPY